MFHIETPLGTSCPWTPWTTPCGGEPLGMLPNAVMVCQVGLSENVVYPIVPNG